MHGHRPNSNGVPVNGGGLQMIDLMGISNLHQISEADSSNQPGAGVVNAGPLIPMASKPYGDQTSLVITLPERGRKRQRRWVLCRQPESILFGIAQHSSNLLFGIQELSPDASVRHLERKTLATNLNRMSQAE